MKCTHFKKKKKKHLKSINLIIQIYYELNIEHITISLYWKPQQQQQQIGK